MSTQSDLHNELAPKIMKEIVKRVSRTGGKPSDMMVILESVAAGLVALSSIPGQEDHAVDLLCAAIKQRVKLLHMMEKPPEGSA